MPQVYSAVQLHTMLGGRNSQPAVQEWQADSVYAAKKCHSLTRGRTDESVAARAVGYSGEPFFMCVFAHVLRDKWS